MNEPESNSESREKAVLNDDLLAVGDFVNYKRGKGILYCGSGTYSRAVVASLTPFVLISESGDMKWSATVEAQNFEKVGEAGRKELLAVMGRLKRELYPVNDQGMP